MPTFYRAQLHPVDGAATVLKLCGNCNNEAEFELHFAKEGLGIGVPIVSLFTDKATLSKKKFYLACPICSDVPGPITKDQAQGLIRKGSSGV